MGNSAQTLPLQCQHLDGCLLFILASVMCPEYCSGTDHAAVKGSVQAPEYPSLHVCRPDTFSLGVCNGCQLMALLGWVPGATTDSSNNTTSSSNSSASTVGTMADASASSSSQFLPDLDQPRFIHNTSGRFECRWTNVTILESPAIMLKVSLHCPS